MGQNFSPTFEPGGDDVLTEAEAAAVEEGFAQAVPMEVVCRQCYTCPPIKCLRMVDWGNPLDGDPPDFDDGNDGTGPPDEDDDPGGSGGPNDPDPDGDDDGDGIRNGDDCGSAAFAGDVATDVRCQDDDGDDINNQDETDCEDNPSAEECQCNCSAEITVESVERFDIPSSVGDLNYLPPHHRLVLKVSAGECDAGNKHTASWEIDAPASMHVFEMESGQGHILEFQSDSGEGQVTITATIECGENTWEDAITFTVKDYDVVDVRYKTWIPADAVPVDIPPFLAEGHKGDGANAPSTPLQFVYRTWQQVVVDLNPNAPLRTVDGPNRAFGESSRYNLSDIVRDLRVPAPWAYTPVSGAQPVQTQTLQVNSGNSTITIQYASVTDGGLVCAGQQIHFMLNASNPVAAVAPPINSESDVRAFQKYTLAAGPEQLLVNARIQHDGFPCHAIWVNLGILHDYNPVTNNQGSPTDLLPPMGPAILIPPGGSSPPYLPWPNRMPRP